MVVPCYSWLGCPNEIHLVQLCIRDGVVSHQPWQRSGTEHRYILGHGRIDQLVHHLHQLHHHQTNTKGAFLASPMEPGEVRDANQHLLGVVLDVVSEQVTLVGHGGKLTPAPRIFIMNFFPISRVDLTPASFNWNILIVSRPDPDGQREKILG